MCVVIDLDVVCIVCLQLSSEMHGIYESVDDTGIHIAQKISTLSKLKVDANNESLPDKICDNCLKDLKAAWRFHKNCQTAVAVFQSILRPLAKKKQLSDPTPQAEETKQDTRKKQVASQKEEKQTSSAISKVNDRKNESGVVSGSLTPVTEVQDVGENVVIDKGTNDEFLELDQDHEDYQAIAETPDDELELVEYYLTEDALQDQEETVDDTVEKSTIKREVESNKTIAAKKIIMNKTAGQVEKVWPQAVAKSVATSSTKMTIPRSRGRQAVVQPLPKATKPINPDIKKSPKQVKRPTRFVYPQQQQTVNKVAPQELPQQQMDENEEQYEPAVRSVKTTRKRKLQSPDAKPPKICEICGNSYRFQHALNAHMRRHFQDKPFPCEMCDKAFVSNVELRRHMRVHTGHKPYACQYCDRRFSDFGSRIKHERTHTGERPYECNTCGKSFAYPHVLSVHLRTHTGEKRFRCDYCSKGFTKKAYLLTHVEQHHSDRDSNKETDRDVTTYELTMEEFGGDTVEEGDEELCAVKEVKFDDCIFTTEFVGDNTSEGQHVDDQDIDSRDGEENHTIILQESLLRPKHEPENDDDESEVQEVEVHLDEYTIRVR